MIFVRTACHRNSTRSLTLVQESWWRIADLRPIDVGKRGKYVWFASLRCNNVLDANASHKERVRDHRPMTAPRNCFGAHQDTTLSARQFRDPLNILCELRGLHIIRITSKREVVPAGVGRISTRVAQASEAGKMGIGNSGYLEGRGECIAIELRIMTRPWHGPHVKYPHNLIAPEQIDECV